MSSDLEQWILPDHGFVHAKHRTTHLNGRYTFSYGETRVPGCGICGGGSV